MNPPLRDRLLSAYFRRNWRGFRTLMKLNRKTTLTHRCAFGALLELHPEEYIDAIVLREGYYETEVIEALRPHLTPGAVLWDVGANIGLHAVTAARLAPGVRIVAFEPNPATFVRLQHHVDLNQAAVSLHPLALGDTDGETKLYMNTTGNSGMSSLVHTGAGSATRVRLAQAATLVATGEVPAPTVVKLDVEGAEEAVLRGFGPLLGAPGLQAVVYEAAADLLADPARCPTTRRLLAAGFRVSPLPRAVSAAHLLANFIARRP